MQSIKIVCGAGGLGDPEREHCFEERLIIFKMINNLITKRVARYVP